MDFTKVQITLSERDDLLLLYSKMSYHSHIVTSAETMYEATKAYYDGIDYLKNKYDISPLAMIHHVDWGGFLMVEVISDNTGTIIRNSN